MRQRIELFIVGTEIKLVKKRSAKRPLKIKKIRVNTNVLHSNNSGKSTKKRSK